MHNDPDSLHVLTYCDGINFYGAVVIHNTRYFHGQDLIGEVFILQLIIKALQYKCHHLDMTDLDQLF